MQAVLRLYKDVDCYIWENYNTVRGEAQCSMFNTVRTILQPSSCSMAAVCPGGIAAKLHCFWQINTTVAVFMLWVVCSPGGSTITGVRALEERGFRGTVIDAIIAAYKRNVELGK